ncbi:MAG: Rpn family recombination-promoting nuclease/putative transposase [Roseburia sp.]|nr:Rpn family recombination-promoting nuclease/putative transposase [Roseburia sp.]
MGERDITEKTLADYNDVFADIVNVLAFEGKLKMDPKDLCSTSVHSQYKADDNKLHEEERDVVKYWKKYRTNIALCGLENQTKIERNMPFRIIGYDGAAYRSQLLKKRKKIVPVTTFVLYFGTKRRWKKPRSIKELMDIPEELEPYVNDYKINVFEIAWLTEKQLKMFRSDFGIVANFFVQKRKNPNYVPNDTRTIEHVDEVLKLLSVMTGDERYIELRDRKKGKVTNMCEVIQHVMDMGRTEGTREGENRLGQLITKLLEAGRNSDVEIVAKDEEARKRFYKEFGITD